MVVKTLADGREAEFDTEQYTPEEIDNYVSRYNAKASQPSAQVPSGDVSGVASVTADPEPNADNDSLLTQAWKYPAAALHGTGRGIAGLGDLALSAGNVLVNDVKSLAGQPVSGSNYVHPLTNAYDENLPAAPKGYEGTSDVASVFGPIAVMEAATGGLASPAAAAMLVPRTAIIGTSGIAGGEIGGGVGEMIGGEKGRVEGEAFGSAILPGLLTAGGRSVTGKVTTDAASRGKLEAIDRLNKNLPPDKQLPIDLGTVGSRGMDRLQDFTGGAVVSGQPALRARAQLYTGLEQALINQFETVRGRGSGTVDPATGKVSASSITPEPSTGQITRESIGAETAGASQKGIKTAEDFIKRVQQDLENDVGASTSADPTAFFDRMDTLMTKVHDEGLRDQIRGIIDDFKRNMPPRIDPATGQPLIDPVTGDPVLTDPSYNAVKGRRSEVGNTLTHQNQPIKKGFSKEGYKGMTEVMKDTAESQGVPASRFDTVEAQTKGKYEDIKQMRKAAEAPDSGAAYGKVFSGTGKQSVEPTEPLARNNPDDLARILANRLDLGIRGPGRAGVSEPKPEEFDIHGPRKGFTEVDPDYRATLTGDIPEVNQAMEDVALLAAADAQRAGKRTLPGGSRGVAPNVSLPLSSILGGAAGLAHGDVLTGLYGLGVGGVGGALANYALGRTMTNPNIVRSLVEAPRTLPGILKDAIRPSLAVKGMAAEGAYNNLESDWQRQRAEQEAAGRILMSQ
jgi:hypothetical protein